jgi:V/A-type H+-transporting ATPase subunit D
MRAKQDLELASEGHRLLDQKREVLILELLHVLARLRDQAKKARELLAKGYAALDEAELSMGSLGLSVEATGPVESPGVSALDRSVMGVAIPTLSVESTGHGPSGTVAATVPEHDEGAAILQEAVPEIVAWAELDLAVYRLAAEVKKTQRRVNALGEIFIPETKSLIARITTALEEAEREEFFRRKRVKAKLRQREHEEAQSTG